ncbi:MAG: hypothetical protein JNK81_17005 [Anaerolineales bacterium]|nr:hypothetical protein [Anaerolineales bacterium]
MRKILVNLISVAYMGNGLWDIGMFFYPIFLSSSPTIDPLLIIFGVWGFTAGYNMFRLLDFGRKQIIFFSYLRIIINFGFIVWFSFFVESEVVFNIYLFNEQIYKSVNPYTHLVGWAIIALLNIMFLSQQKTKELFVTEKEENLEDKSEGIIIETEKYI